MWQLASFLIISLILAFVSRKSLRNRHSHGFYRFFAWECILALTLINIPAWFNKPFASHQLLSWLLLLISLFPLVMGVNTLGSAGTSSNKDRRSEPELFTFERTTHLVTNGVYKKIRHPLYGSLFVLTWGVFFKVPSLTGLVLALGASFFLFITAKVDEAECIRTFGNGYKEYMQHTKMFIPYLL